ncbi:MAG TPA: STAS domain-containing protein, partial [Pirellula sp.]|nr:STAS domain-containing protein [Pirellula sp.]
MADLSSATSDAIKELAVIRTAACIVDLSSLSYMESSVVACVVRFWKAIKAQSGTIVVVAPSEGIKDILNITGLQKFWPIVDTLEAAIHALGFSIEAKVAKRERRLLIFVGPIALICGAVAVAVRLWPPLTSFAEEASWLIYSIAGLSVVASSISSIREIGWRRLLSIIVLMFGMALMGSCFALIKPKDIKSQGSTSSLSEFANTKGNKDDERSKASTGPRSSEASDDPAKDDV